MLLQTRAVLVHVSIAVLSSPFGVNVWYHSEKQSNQTPENLTLSSASLDHTHNEVLDIVISEALYLVTSYMSRY